MFVSFSPCGIYFDTIRESLHTPCRNQFSHSGPPLAVVTSPWLWVTRKGYRGPVKAHPHTHTDTCLEKYFANDENYRTCPLVKVPSSSFNCVLQVALGIGRWQTQQCFVWLQSTISISDYVRTEDKIYKVYYCNITTRVMGLECSRMRLSQMKSEWQFSNNA